MKDKIIFFFNVNNQSLLTRKGISVEREYI